MASDNDVTPEGPHFVRICGFQSIFSDFTSTHAQVFSCSLCFLADGKHVQRQRNLLLRRLLYLRAGRGATATANKWRVTHFLSYPGLSLMDG